MNKMLNVKPFQETLGIGVCGAASLKIVLGYYGVVKSEGELCRMCGTTVELGTDDEGIVRAAGELGFCAEVKNDSSFEDIAQWLNRGVPVIVDWFTRGRIDYADEDVADGHYSVVVGLDDEYIYLQDPEIGKLRKLTREDFLSVWFDFTGHTIHTDELIIRQLIAVYKK